MTRPFSQYDETLDEQHDRVMRELDHPMYGPESSRDWQREDREHDYTPAQDLRHGSR